MRILKFRAWYLNYESLCENWKKNNPKMTYAPVFTDGYNSDYVCSVNDNNAGFDDPEIAWMQFIGLNDKNGKDIYEGDILKNERGDWGVVVYKAPAFEVTVSETQSSLYTKEWIEACEIIGNIYENPELLQQ